MPIFKLIFQLLRELLRYRKIIIITMIFILNSLDSFLAVYMWGQPT